MVDRFVSTYKHDERKFTQDMCNDIVKFLTNSLFARSNNFVPICIQSQPSSSTKSVSFAAVAKTLRNSGADFYAKQPQSTTLLGSRPTTISGGVSLPPTSPSSTNSSVRSSMAKKEDRRLLITIEPTALLNRPEPFALRQELATKIPGISLASVPLVTPTKTGWAITLANLLTRDLLQANAEIILRIFNSTTPAAKGSATPQNAPATHDAAAVTLPSRTQPLSCCTTAESRSPPAPEALLQPQPIAYSQAADTNPRKRKGSTATAQETSS
ncbi:hypothetical protein V500_03800 [Pseudogymnoascus sp. VKM F-4518 (FW-2643)]|nr:hypothetical protein V500_03800 [Pseudogymnoascus sp. VKM F-4518 (FW-2643)]